MDLLERFFPVLQIVYSPFFSCLYQMLRNLNKILLTLSIILTFLIPYIPQKKKPNKQTEVKFEEV